MEPWGGWGAISGPKPARRISFIGPTIRWPSPSRRNAIDLCVEDRRCLIDRCPEQRGSSLWLYALNAAVTFEGMGIEPL